MKKLFLTALFLLTIVVNVNAIIGNTSNGTSTDPIWDSSVNRASINATRFLASSNETVTTIYGQVVGMTGHYKCAIYAGTSATATKLLSGTSQITNPTSGWYPFPLTSNVTITNGQYYWLAVWGDAPPAAMSITPNTGTTIWQNIAYSTTWPDPFVQGGSFTATYCIYATNAGAQVTSPIVTLTSPPNGSTYTAPASINLASSVTANGHTLNKVQFFNSTTLLGEDTSSPYTFSWTSVPTGNYSLSAKVTYDTTATLSSTPAVNVSVITFTPPSTNTGNVTLAWDPSPSTTNTVITYKIKYGPSSGNYTNTANANTALTLTVSNLFRGSTYYFAAFAYDPFNIESLPSNEVYTNIPIVVVTNKPGSVNGVRVN